MAEVYTAYYDRNYDTIEGLFTIQNSKGEKLFERLPTRSGQVAWTDTSWERGKSPIPYGSFKLWLDSYNKGTRAGARGIGEFFPISTEEDRHTIYSAGRRRKRTAIGLHEENTIPGSAGCIVLLTNTPERLEKVQELYKFLTSLKGDIDYINLRVL